MTWFKVDDKFHSHSKVRKVLAEEPAALALWVVAGSWSSDNLTDGLIPDHQLPWLIPSGADELAQKLVTTRLWRRVRGGYQFHQWSEDGDRTKRNPTREEVEEERRKKAEAGRLGGISSGRKRQRSAIEGATKEGRGTDEGPSSTPVDNHRGGVPGHAETRAGSASTSSNTRSKTEARGSAGASARAKAPADRLVEPPTRPDPTFIGGRSTYVPNGGAREDPPPPQCPEHLGQPNPPRCGPCGDHRRARDRWETERARRVADAPQCRTHRGQLAASCGPCRSEQLAAPEE